MKRVVMTSLLLLVAGAAHAGDFDGRWQALGPQAGVRCWAGYLNLAVTGSEVTGIWENSSMNAHVLNMKGTVNPDGSFQIAGDGYVFTGRFDGDKVSAEFDGDCGHRVATGGRVIAPAHW